MTDVSIPDESENGRNATGKNLIKNQSICGTGILFTKDSAPLFIMKSDNKTQQEIPNLELTVAAWIYLKEVNYVILLNT